MRVVSVSVAVQPSAGKLGGTMRHNGRVNVIRFSADGTRMYSGDSEGGILVWEVDGRDASASTAAFTPFCFIMHPDFEGKNITSMVVQPKQDGRNRLLVMAYNVRWRAARCVVVRPYCTAHVVSGCVAGCAERVPAVEHGFAPHQPRPPATASRQQG